MTWVIKDNKGKTLPMEFECENDAYSYISICRNNGRNLYVTPL